MQALAQETVPAPARIRFRQVPTVQVWEPLSAGLSVDSSGFPNLPAQDHAACGTASADGSASLHLRKGDGGVSWARRAPGVSRQHLSASQATVQAHTRVVSTRVVMNQPPAMQPGSPDKLGDVWGSGCSGKATE